MDYKGALFLCCLGLAKGGIIATDYSPAVSHVYSSYNPTLIKTVSTPVVTKTIAPVFGKAVIATTGPYYESIVTTHESNHKSSDGSQHTSFSKTLDTAFSKVNKFESRTSNNGVLLTQSLPSIYSLPTIHSGNTVYHDTAYGVSTPLYKSVSPVLTNTFSQPVVYTAPVLTKTVTPVLKKTEIVSPALTAHVTPVLKTVSGPIVTKSVAPLVYTSPVVTKTVTPVLNKAVVAPTVIHTAPVKSAFAYSPTPLVAHASFSGLGANYSW